MNKKAVSLFIICFVLVNGLGSISFAKTNDEYTFIILTPVEFFDTLLPLMTHKQNHGISTKIITLNDINESVYFPAQGRDDPERIKYFIKNAIENWNTQYVMFVGNKENMPVRYSVIVSNNYQQNTLDNLLPSSFSFQSGSFITDLYYADIYDENDSFCSWDSNNNSIFGEIGLDGAIDEVDLYPDICVGRVLCQTIHDVDIIVNKIIDYENNVYGENWLKNIILCGGDTHPNTWEEILLALLFKNITGDRYRIAWEGEYMGDQIDQIMDTFTTQKLYSTGILRIRAKRLTLKNINQAINDGAAFVLFSTHGTPTKMATYPPFNKKRWIELPSPDGYNISHISQLTNSEKLPIIVSSGCSNGDFDTIACPIAWEFVHHDTGGGIASFALTTSGNIYPTTMYTESLSGHTIMSVFEAYADGVDIIGEIWAETISRYLNDEWAWSINEYLSSNGNSVVWLNLLALEEWILFGDPSLKIGGYE